MFLGTFFTISSENISSTIGWASTLISDTQLLWLLIVGVGIGVIILTAIINAIRH